MGKMAFRKFLCRVFEGFVKFFCCFKRVLGPMQIDRPPKPDEVEPTKKDQTSEVRNMRQRIAQTSEDASSKLANQELRGKLANLELRDKLHGPTPQGIAHSWGDASSKLLHMELRDMQTRSSPSDIIRLM